MPIVTVIQRLEYLKGVYQNTYGVDVEFSDFMECLFAKLEQETRDGTCGIDKYFQEGYHKQKPINLTNEKYEYVYDR
jgi:hypothetical protein